MRVGTRWTPAVLAAVVALATRAAAHVHGHHGDEHRHRTPHLSFDVVGFGRTKIYAMAVGASLVTACVSLVCSRWSRCSRPPKEAARRRHRRHRRPGRSTRNRKDASWAAPSQGLVRATLSAFAVGAFLGDAFLHQFPHAYAHAATSRGGDGGGGFASGLWSTPRARRRRWSASSQFHLVERAVDARHGSRGSHGGHGHGCHGRRTVARRKKDDDICGERLIEPKDQTQRKETLGYLNLADGRAQSSPTAPRWAPAFLAERTRGRVRQDARHACEVPQEIGDFGVLVSAGFKRL